MTNLVTVGDRLTLRHLALDAHLKAEQRREEEKQEREVRDRTERLTKLRDAARRILGFTPEHAEEVIPASGEGYGFTVDGLHFKLVNRESWPDDLSVYVLHPGGDQPCWAKFSDLETLGGILSTSSAEDPAEWVTLYDTREDQSESDAYRYMRRADADRFLAEPGNDAWQLLTVEG